ncbi:HAD domain-containing protein [Chryseobacterium gleum]|uniref:HAD domain-containing protein n=1 Tax=Chryseobacterium gleum TaxID=250 RepID=UPI0028AE94EA|nr:HAD domain-containing protein [Chryseobacterium gleum]
MKIIFVDIDGVLNNAEYYKNKSLHSHHKENSHFDPRNVTALNRIISSTGVKMVLSSAWRLIRSLEEINELFKEVNLNVEIISVTESLHYKDTFELAPRGLEILKWIRDYHKTLKGGLENYVIIDDEDDILDIQEKHFFQIDDKVGLTEADANEIIEFLNSYTIPKTELP